MSLVRWDPFRDLEEMAEQVDHYLGHPVLVHSTDNRKESPGMPDWVPVADVVESPQGYLVQVDLPGLGTEDVKVSVDSHVLSIAGERKPREQEKDTTFHRVESAYGSFLRRFALPDDVDEAKLQADFKNGVLSVQVPKAERALPRAIEVKAA